MDAARPVPLRDFLYRDNARLASYYAQVFGGRLVSKEVPKSSRTTHGSSYGGNVQILKGDKSSSAEAATSEKAVFEPHDVSPVALIDELLSGAFVDCDPIQAPNGRLIHAKGILYLFDGWGLQTALSAFEGVIVETLTKGHQKRELRDFAKTLKATFGGLSVPSMFLLETDAGVNFIGTIKPDGLDEPVSAFNFKHGENGLPGVHLLGLKEVAAPLVRIPETSSLKMTQGLAKAFGDMLIPEKAQRATAGALYRELRPAGVATRRPRGSARAVAPARRSRSVRVAAPARRRRCCRRR